MMKDFQHVWLYKIIKQLRYLVSSTSLFSRQIDGKTAEGGGWLQHYHDFMAYERVTDGASTETLSVFW